MSKDLTRQEKRQKQVSKDHDWSNLCPDLLRAILENSSLSLIDFQVAKTVCSDWYKVWRTCVKPPPYPWGIIFLGDSSMLFDPKEDKFYETKHLGLDFSDNSYCMATSGNWLLLVDPRLNFYLLNVLTRERINLPLMGSSNRGGKVRFGRIGPCGHFVEPPSRKDFESKDIIRSYQSAFLSINEKTGDYFVAWILKQQYLFTHKKGDDSWWNWNFVGAKLSILDLAYKNNKLYMYTCDNHIKILDFSGDFPKEEIEENPYRGHPCMYFCLGGNIWKKKKIAIRNSGEVLIIWSIKSFEYKRLMFYIFKMNLETKEWEIVKSIGDNEMLIYGHGVTIRAPVQDVGGGFKSDSICFIDEDNEAWISNGVFDLATSKITCPKKLDVFLNHAKWFVPGFA